MDKKMRKSKKIKDLEMDLTQSEEVIVLPSIEKPNYQETSCAELYRKFTDKQLEIQHDFQRNFVWNSAAQTCFIDSLVKGLPIPNLCIVEDSNTENWIVIDGLQRISTIIKFLGDTNWKLTKSPDIIDANISGKKVSEIKKKSPTLYKRVENTVIPVTVIRCDFSTQSSMDNLFNIFHRLNTGGQKLNNQEIRNCIFSGRFNKLLRNIVKSEEWTNIMGKTSKVDRLDNEELVLRVFAFLDKLDEYTGNLAKFLNHYMSEKQNITNDEIDDKEDTLTSTLSFISENIDNPASVSKLNKTQKEGLLVGIAKNIETITSKSKEEFQAMFEEFNEENLKHGLSKKEKVQSRLRKSISIFKG